MFSIRSTKSFIGNRNKKWFITNVCYFDSKFASFFHFFIQINSYGKLGVEFHYQFEDDDNDCQEIVQIFFISRLAAILCLCEDFSIHLLKIPTKSTNSDITKLYSNNFFVQNNDGDNDHHTNQQPSKIITSLALNEKQTILFIGLNNGDIQLMNIDDSLSLKDDSTIKLDEILKSIPEDLKLKPGSVEVIQEQPGQDGKILIGYNRSLIVLWNYQQKSLENYFHIEQVIKVFCFRLLNSSFL